MSYRPKLSKLHYPALTFIVTVLIAIILKIFVVGDNIKEPKYRVEPELEGYLKSFVNLADLKGIDLTYIYSQNITIKWASPRLEKRNTNVATAYGRNKDAIIIFVNKKRFEERTEEGRKYVMFHELGHDILNLRHLKGRDELEHGEELPRGMMEPTAYTGFFRDYERFDQQRQQDYLYRALNQMFDRFNAEEWHLYQNNNQNKK